MPSVTEQVRNNYQTTGALDLSTETTELRARKNEWIWRFRGPRWQQWAKSFSIPGTKNEVWLILRPQNCVPGKTKEIRGFVTAVGTQSCLLFFALSQRSTWVLRLALIGSTDLPKKRNWLSRIHYTFFFHCLLLNVKTWSRYVLLQAVCGWPTWRVCWTF